MEGSVEGREAYMISPESVPQDLLRQPSVVPDVDLEAGELDGVEGGGLGGVGGVPEELLVLGAEVPVLRRDRRLPPVLPARLPRLELRPPPLQPQLPHLDGHQPRAPLVKIVQYRLRALIVAYGKNEAAI